MCRGPVSKRGSLLHPGKVFASPESIGERAVPRWLACLPHLYVIGHRSDTLPIWRPGERTDDSVMTAIGEDLRAR